MPKVRFPDDTLTYACCGFRSWPCGTEWTWSLLSVTKMWQTNCSFWALWCLYEFSRGFTATGATNRSGTAKIANCSHYAA